MVARDVIEEAAREEGVDVEEAAQRSGGRKQDGSGTQEGEETAAADADGAGAGGRISNRCSLLPRSHLTVYRHTRLSSPHLCPLHGASSPAHTHVQLLCAGLLAVRTPVGCHTMVVSDCCMPCLQARRDCGGRWPRRRGAQAAGR